jgi:hypothetical protein
VYLDSPYGSSELPVALIPAYIPEESLLEIMQQLTSSEVFIRVVLVNDGSGLMLHADNGGPMKGVAMLAILLKLDILQPFSRLLGK